MRIAVPAWQERVSPVLDFAQQVVLVDLAGRNETRRRERLGSQVPHERAGRLDQLDVDVVICGAVSRTLEGLIAARGIRLIPLICGRVEEVIRAFRDGTLNDGGFAMPGCCRKRRQARHL